MEDSQVLFAPSREVRDDLHKVRRAVTAAGNVRFQAESDEAGHADRFWALALALEAARRGFSGPAGMEPLSEGDGPNAPFSASPDHSGDLY